MAAYPLTKVTLNYSRPDVAADIDILQFRIFSQDRQEPQQIEEAFTRVELFMKYLKTAWKLKNQETRYYEKDDRAHMIVPISSELDEVMEECIKLSMITQENAIVKDMP
jgi:hypothetical protein